MNRLRKALAFGPFHICRVSRETLRKWMTFAAVRSVVIEAGYGGRGAHDVRYCLPNERSASSVAGAGSGESCHLLPVPLPQTIQASFDISITI
jgi:hypothetical protein